MGPASRASTARRVGRPRASTPSRRAIVGTPLTIPVVVLVRHDHEVAVAQRLDVLGRVLRAEAEAQDLDDVLDLRRDARRGAPGAVGRLSRPRRRRRGDRVASTDRRARTCRIEWRATTTHSTPSTRRHTSTPTTRRHQLTPSSRRLHADDASIERPQNHEDGARQKGRRMSLPRSS